MKKFTVSVNAANENGNANFNFGVEATDVLDALEKAKEQLATTIAAAGLAPVKS